MNISCNGRTYDTAGAELVASDSNPDEWSNAGWHLYRTPRGSHFQVAYGHEGEEVGFRVIDYDHAQDLIAKHKVTPAF
jgi:hypothetical protein